MAAVYAFTRKRANVGISYSEGGKFKTKVWSLPVLTRTASAASVYAVAASAAPCLESGKSIGTISVVTTETIEQE